MRIVARDRQGSGWLGFRDSSASYPRLELLALGAGTLAILFGIWIALTNKVARFDRESADVININRASPTELAARLNTFETSSERLAVAKVLIDWREQHGVFTHVGALANVRLSPTAIAARPALVTANRRLLGHPGAGSVPLLSDLDVSSAKPKFQVRTLSEYRQLVFRAAALFFGCFWFLHIVEAFVRRRGDELLLPIAQVLSGIGLIAMLGVRDPVRDTMSATEFSKGVAFGGIAFFACSCLDWERIRHRLPVFLTLGSALLLAAALLLLGSGPSESGVKVNLFGFQPVELIKLMLAFSLAGYFSRKWEPLRDLDEETPLGGLIRSPRWADVTPFFWIVGLPILFFFLQKDLGPALVFGCMALILYSVARSRSVLLVAGLAAILAAFAIGHAIGIPATVAKRVAIWAEPWDNALRRGDQVAHGLWALSSGATLGVGAGNGDGQFVPAGPTDLILPIIGEELGVVGTLTVILLQSLLVWRMLVTARRATGDYSAFLAAACGLSIAVPAVVITSGVLGLLPLTGVVTPFLSLGKSSMICNFAALGICGAISRGRSTGQGRFASQLESVRLGFVSVVVILAVRLAYVQVWAADEIALRPTLALQGDGGVRLSYNPRLQEAAKRLTRGSVFDRNGLVLATSTPELTKPLVERLSALGLGGTVPCLPNLRCYPLGGAAFHILGDLNRQANWAASNASFVERDDVAALQGYDDHPRAERRRLPDGSEITVIAHDFRELLPLVRHKDNTNGAVRGILDRPRDLKLAIDGPLQLLVARALESRIKESGMNHGAVVVLDSASGDVLALASYPWPELATSRGTAVDPATLLDRARYGLYPPGSTFKLVTAAAALEREIANRNQLFRCDRMKDGRPGADLAGHIVHDDPLDKQPHGQIALRQAIVVSCNAYFAQLGRALGADALIAMANPTKIRLASDPVLPRLRGTLPEASFGQGEVLASPMRLARVVAAIASDGQIREQQIEPIPSDSAPKPIPWLGSSSAAFLRDAMRQVVLSGTGRVLSGHSVPIAGKTGTAELDGAASHSWFVGFAPAGRATTARTISFAVLVENAGYGGRVAAPLAGDVVTAAKRVGLIR